jgi:hypothetical protein
MNTQPQLFYEDVYDVLRAAVQALGGTKAVAGKLWPHKPITEAQRELLDALNRERPRKLDAEEIMAVLRFAGEAGFHGAKHWIDHAIGYQPTAPLDPLIERDRLAEALERAASTFEALKQQATNLLERDKRLKAVR